MTRPAGNANELDFCIPIALQDTTTREKAQNGRGWNDDGTSYTTREGSITDTSHAVAFNMHKSGNEASSLGISVDKVDCLRAFEKSPFAVQPSPTMQVRRLTPVECERLQGFPDNYTMIPWRKKLAEECPDGPRYKALGNSWAVPVVAWIGGRINESMK